MKTKLGAFALVFLAIALASCTGFKLEEQQVPPVGEANTVLPTAVPTNVPTQSETRSADEDIVIVKETSALVPAGYAVAGDVAVGSSEEGPWTELYDDKAETGLVVSFFEATWVLAPWGDVVATMRSAQELQSEAVASGCGLSGGCPEVVVINWPTEAETFAVQYEPTPVPVPDPMQWVLPTPPGPDDLPQILRGEEILYRQPPDECSVANDPNETCSTIEGQATNGSFTLHSGEAILMTGDAIAIARPGEDKPLVLRPYDGDSVHDEWLLVNLSEADWNLIMNAPYGSFRGYYTAPGGWYEGLIAHLRDLHLYLFNLPTQTWERFYPTPVPNCGSPEGCPFVNVRLGIYFGDDQIQWFNGYWDEVGEPHWTPSN